MKNTKFLKLVTIIAFQLALFLSISSGHAEVFVSTSGSDETGDGSIENPFLTPHAAVLASNPSGDTITFRGGTYSVTKSIRIENPNTTLRSYPGEWAVIEGAIDDESMYQIVWFRDNSKGGKIQRLELAGGYFYTVKFENFKWYQITSIHTNRNYVIEDSILRDSGRDLIKIAPGIDNVIIRRNHFARSGLRDPGNADGIDDVNGNNLLVQDNFFEDIATAVLYAKGGAKNAIIERNISINTNSGILLGFATDTEWFDRDNLDERGKSIYENIDGIVRNNIIINTRHSGIGLFAANRPQVYNNTLVNVGSAGFSAIAIEPDIDPYMSRGSSTDVTIRNNIVVQAADSEYPMVRIRCHRGVSPCVPGLKGYLEMSNNIYYKNGASPIFEDQRPESKFIGDFAGWQAHIDSDTNSQVIDPKLDSNYHLTAESIAINAGYNIKTIIDDYEGLPRTDQFDIGADEYSKLYYPVPPRDDTVGTGAPETVPDYIPPVFNDLRLERLNSKSAMINWSSNENSSNIIEYGLTNSYGNEAYSSEIPAHTHSVVLPNLEPTTTYHYRISSTDYAGNTSVLEDRTFTTPEIAYTTISAKIDGVVGGTLSPSGDTSIMLGDKQVYQIKAHKGYNIAQVLVDGVDQGIIESYEFDNVNDVHSLTVKFEPLPTTDEQLPGSPLLYYTFDSVEGDVIADLSGHSHNGILKNGAQLSDVAAGGNALLLDGDDDYMEIADHASLNIKDTLTVGAWIKRERKMMWETIYDGGADSGWAFQMRGGSHAVEYRAKYDGQYADSNTAGVSDSNWHHVLLTSDGVTTKFYIDGGFVRSFRAPATEMPSGIKKIGAQKFWRKDPHALFKGSIDNFILYDRVLTADEAKLVYKKTGLTTEEMGDLIKTTTDTDGGETNENPNDDSDENSNDGSDENSNDDSDENSNDDTPNENTGVQQHFAFLDIAGTTKEELLNEGFEQGVGSLYASSKVTMSTIEEDAITGSHSLRLASGSHGSVYVGHQYDWGAEIYGKALQIYAKANIPALYDPKGLIKFCSVVYYIGNVREESCQDIPGTHKGDVTVNAVLDLDPSVRVRRVYNWIQFKGYGPYKITVDDMRLVMYRSDNNVEPEPEETDGFSLLSIDGTTAEELVDEGFEQGIGSLYASSKVSTNRVTDGAITGTHSLDVSSGPHGRAYVGHQYNWGAEVYGKALQIYAKAHIPEAHDPKALIKFCSVVYYIGNVRKESCQDIPGTQTGDITVDAVLDLDPTVRVRRVYHWLQFKGYDSYNITVDDMHLVMYRTN